MLIEGVAMTATQAPPELQILDEMDDISPWQALAADGTTASVHAAKGVQGGALVLQFDLAKTAGYAAATRKLAVELPEDYEISFWMRATAGRNNLEVKFVDASGDNVWWFRRANYKFSGEWQNVRIKRRQVEFAWGPTQDKVLKRFASMEFVVSAGTDGGSGSLWFDRLALQRVDPLPPAGPPTVQASSQRRGHEAALVMDGKASTAWRSQRKGKGPSAPAQTLTVDLQQPREFGGLEIDWLRGMHASSYTIQLSMDGKQWQTVRSVTAGNGGRDSHLLPESEARWIRLTMQNPGHDLGIAELHVRDLDFGASPNAFVEALAKDARRGCYPRGFTNQQSYWTIVGVDGDSEQSLLSEDGAVEPRRAGFSIEPFVRNGDTLVTWADADITHSLAENYLPIPTVQWRRKDMVLAVTAIAQGKRGDAQTRVVYKLSNPAATPQKLSLALVIRPFQVNPPAQFLNTAGGVTSIQDIAWRDGVVQVDKLPGVIPESSPTTFRAVTMDADTPCDWLTTAPAADSVHDETGMASAAMIFDVDLAPGEQREISLDLPLHAQSPVVPSTRESVQATTQEWREKLNRVELQLPPDAQPWFDTLRTALAHVLITRDGPALQPGARSYRRSWIRDGAMISEMLLRLGHPEDVKDFLLWYAPFQFSGPTSNGKIPCCVDVRGADPVPENDSNGEFLYLVAEFYRYTGDREVLDELWPRVRTAVAYMEQLRASERTSLNQEPGRRALYGLMPASISHEGYSAKPMHSYWDDFWALAGYESAVRIARALDEKADMRSFIQSRDQFRADLYRSLQIAMQEHKIDYLPGAAELGDFDPTSTSIALSPVGEQQMLPPDALQATFERYWKNFTERRSDQTWDAYTPYELRNLGTFIRLGWRDRGLELLEFFLNDRRPAQWNQWAEVVGREPRKSRFIGDMPHGWVASDYARSLLDMFAYERPADETLVLMAGVPDSWLQKDGFAVKNLRTAYGPLSYSFTIKGNTRILEIGELKLPPGGVSVSWPEKPAGKQTVHGGSARWIDKELRIGKLPFSIEFTQ
jgi:hypothetical protein